MMIVKKIKEKLAKWVMKDMSLPIQPIIVENQSLRKFHAQRIITYNELRTNPMPRDWYVANFKDEVANALMEEIQINMTKTPDGLLYSVGLFFQNIYQKN